MIPARVTRSKTKIHPQQHSDQMPKVSEEREYNDDDYHQFPIYPDVRLQELPFYDVIATLLQPSSLVPCPSQNISTRTFFISLTPQQLLLINGHRSTTNDMTNFAYQVQLRLCLAETTSDQKDCYPSELEIRVNNKEFSLPPPLPVRPGEPIKRHQLPLNITGHIKLNSAVSNKIEVSWKPEITKNFAVSICLVHKLDSHELMKRLISKGIKPAEFTRGLIKEKFKVEDTDNEIATTILRVSLTCPLSKTRMVHPCRAITCTHLQCFDAISYLFMNERKSTWKCPICDQTALYKDLAIDEYFLNVINSPLICSNEKEIQLYKDGLWVPFSLGNCKIKNENADECIEVLSDDDEDIGHVKVEQKAPPPVSEASADEVSVNNLSLRVKNKPTKRQKASSSATNLQKALKKAKTSRQLNNRGLESQSSSQDLICFPPEISTIDLTLDD